MLDLEASPEHMTRSTTKHVEHMLLVAEPYFKSLETARRYHHLAVDLGIPRVSIVGNKVKPGDESLVLGFCEQNDFELIQSVPYEQSFAEAERLGIAPIDHAPASEGVSAVRRLAKGMLESA